MQVKLGFRTPVERTKRAPVTKNEPIKKWEVVDTTGYLSYYAQLYESKPVKIRYWKIFGKRFRGC